MCFFVKYLSAAQQDSEEYVALLLKHGADPSAVDSHGNIALYYAG